MKWTIRIELTPEGNEPITRSRSVGSTRLPISSKRHPPSPSQISACAILGQCGSFNHSHPGDQACQRQADSWCGSNEPRFGASLLQIDSKSYFSIFPTL
jgi:hypothetical protein